MFKQLVPFAIVSCAAPMAIAQTASFTPLGIPPDHHRAVVYDVSADGNVVVGTARRSSSLFHSGFAYSDGQLQLLANGPNGPGNNGEFAFRVSADGRVVIGAEGWGRGLRWMDGVAEVASPPGGSGFTGLSAISASGHIIYSAPYRLQAGTWSSLSFFTSILDCTDDGETFVGVWSPPAGGFYTAIQTSDGSILIPQPGQAPGSCRLSANGQFLVHCPGSTPLLWQIGQLGYTLVDYPQGLVYMREVSGISDDGRIIVGSTTSPNSLLSLTGPTPTDPALLWHADRGSRSVANLLGQLGVDTAGWQLICAAGCSRDGLTLAGTGINPQGVLEGWRVTLPGIPASPDFNNSLIVDVADIFAYLSAWFAGDPLADFNLDGAIGVPDIFQFLQYWFGRLL